MRYGFFKAAGAAALAVVFLALPSLGFAESPPAVIRLAAPGNAAGTPYGNGILGIVRAKKLLEAEFKSDGTKIEWQFPRGTGPAINEAFANGQLDFAGYGGLPNIVGRGAGLATKVLASDGTAPVYVVARNGSHILSLKDLSGKNISVSRGTIFEWSLDRILAHVGLNESGIKIFDLESADQISAFSAGDIDAIVAGYNLLDLVNRGLGKVVYTTKGSLGPGTNFGSFVVTDDFAHKYPETTQRVLNVYVKAAFYASQEAHRSEIYDLWTLTDVPRADFAKDYAGDSLRDRLSPLLDGFYLSNVKSGIAFSLASHLIRRPFDVAGWVDPSYLNKALKTLGYEGFWRSFDANGKPQG